MRVSRALERLREVLAAKGPVCGSAALGAMLTGRSVQAAPASLVAALLCMSWPIPVAVNAGLGFAAAVPNISRVKLALGAMTVVLVTGVAFLATRARQPRVTRSLAIDAPADASGSNAP